MNWLWFEVASVLKLCKRPKYKNPVMCLWEKICVLDKLCSG